MLRIRRFYFGVFLLAAMPVVYFIFHVHNEATSAVKVPTSSHGHFKSKEERHIRFVQTTSKYIPELPIKPHDRNNALPSLKRDVAEFRSTGKHHKLFKEFSSGLIDMDGFLNRTKAVQSNTALNLHPSHAIRPTSRSTGELPHPSHAIRPHLRRTDEFQFKEQNKNIDTTFDLNVTKVKVNATAAISAKVSAVRPRQVPLARTSKSPDRDQKVPNVTTENPYMIKVKVKADVIKPEPVSRTKSRAWRASKDSSSSKQGRERELQETLTVLGSRARESVTAGYSDVDQRNGRNVRIGSRPTFKFPDAMPRKRAIPGAFTAGTLAAPEGTTRPKTCNACFQPRISYVINPKHVCKHAGDRILVLVIVFSEHSHRDKRTVIRETWGSATNKNVGVVRLVFVLGDIDNTNEKAETRAESARYGDILMGNFKDSFRNLTLKTMTGLGWATYFCTQAKYVLKTDDDMWVNIPMFLQIEPQFELEKVVAGTCWLNRWEPHRQENDKYYVSESEYPASFYPELCVGTAYVMTLQTASDIYRVHPNIPYFHLEDVYVALCREYLGYGVVPLPGFYNKKEPFSVCYYRTNLVTSHWVSEAEIREAWTKECSLAPKDPIVEFLNRYLEVSLTHPRHQIGRQR